MPVRPMRESDRAEVLAMMRALWPAAATVALNDEQVFVWVRSEGGLAGFISVSLRPFADGCESEPCPYIEGWWVAPELRGQGVGRALVAAVEAWARGGGYRELASDAELENTGSIAAHQALGFEPTERLQMFRKRLR